LQWKDLVPEIGDTAFAKHVQLITDAINSLKQNAGPGVLEIQA
jgi:hypothetical protein